MGSIERISPRKACEMMQSEPKTVLVCGYDDEEKFHKNHIEGAISLHEFVARKDTLLKEQPIIFYCACPHDETALSQAEKFQKEGFTNVRVLEGGINAWHEAGCEAMLT